VQVLVPCVSPIPWFLVTFSVDSIRTKWRVAMATAVSHQMFFFSLRVGFVPEQLQVSPLLVYCAYFKWRHWEAKCRWHM